MTVLSLTCFEAAQQGEIVVIDDHLNNRVRINDRDENGCTMVHHAAAHNQVKALEFLQNNGANFQLVDNNGRSAMHYAAEYAHVDAVIFLQKKIELYSKDSYGNTPLHFAAIRGQTNILQHYTAHGVEHLHPLNANNESPLAVAILNNKDDFALSMDLSGSNKVNVCNTSLRLAVERNKIPLAQKLSEFTKDGSVYKKWSINDETAFKRLVDNNHAEALALLVRHMLKCTQPQALELVLYAVRNCRGNTDIISAIKDLFVIAIPVDAAGYYRTGQENYLEVYYKAAQAAAFNGHIKVMDQILSIYATPWKGWDGLSYAHPAFDFNRVVDNKTLLSSAIEGDQCEMVAHVLDQRGARPGVSFDAQENHSLLLAVSQRKLSIATELLVTQRPKIPNPDYANKAGYTALHVAVLNADLKMMELLLSKEANPNIPMNRDSVDGDTPLHLAVNLGNPSVVRLLLEKGANPNAFNKPGYTALHLAAKQENSEMIALLLQHGGNNTLRTQCPVKGKNAKDANCTASDLTKNVLCRQALERSDSSPEGFAHFIYQQRVDSSLKDLLIGLRNYVELVKQMKEGVSRGALIYTLINTNHINRNPAAIPAMAAKGQIDVISYINASAEKDKLVSEALKEGTPLNRFIMAKSSGRFGVLKYTAFDYLQDLNRARLVKEGVISPSLSKQVLASGVGFFTEKVSGVLQRLTARSEPSQSSTSQCLGS